MASDYEPPWRMVINNWGKTPGCVTSIEWGYCPDGAFSRDISVSRLIDDKTLPVKMVDVQEMFAPTGRPIPYRHVQPPQGRVVGHVFFGRIRYRDVFGDPHHSTFALLHREEYTDSIGRSFADDVS